MNSMQLQPRMLTLLKEFMQPNMICSSNQLASILHVSSKTVRNDIKELNDILTFFGAQIDTIIGKGYQLKIENQTLFKQFLKDYIYQPTSHNEAIPTNRKQRIQYLIIRLLLAEDYLKLEHLADELYVSESSIKNDLKGVREELRQYQIKLEVRPKYGMIINATELQIRFCMSEYLFQRKGSEMELLNSNISILPEEEIQIIEQSIIEEVHDNNISFSDIGLKNLVIHLAIACKRIREQNYVSIIPDDLKVIIEQKEYDVAKQIVSKIEKALQITFPTIEIAYIAIHLLGTKMVTYQSLTGNEVKTFFNDETYQLSVAMLKKIEEQLDLHIDDDQELLFSLCLHLKPAINRYKYGMNIRNPMLDNIKLKYPLAFEAGTIAASVIKEQIGMAIDENEIGYLAIHIGAAMERLKLSGKKKRCVIVCASGIESAKLLYYNLQATFKDRLEIVDTIPYYRMNLIEYNRLDFIISTIPIKETTPIPVIQVNTFANEKDLKQIEMDLFKSETRFKLDFIHQDLIFLQQSFDSKEKVLCFLEEKLLEKGLIEKDFLPAVWRREQIAPTAFGNFVAIPHPDWPQTEQTFWAVCSLKKPIDWDGEKVQFICMLSVKKKNMDDLKYMYEILGEIINSANLLQQVLQVKTIEAFIDLIENIIK